MQAAATPQVEEAIQRALRHEWMTELSTISYTPNSPSPPLTDTDAQCIIECLQGNPRLHTLRIITSFHIQNPVLNVFRNGLPLCPAVTTINLRGTKLSNEGLELLLPAFYNTTVTSLHIGRTGIQGRRGGEFLRDLLDGNNTLIKLYLSCNPIDPEMAVGLGNGLAVNNRLQTLYLVDCNIGNDSLANLLPADGIINNSLTELYLAWNNIEGAHGGRQVSLFLQHFPTVKWLFLNQNHRLGPLGAGALAPVLTLPSHGLERLCLGNCGIGNDGVAALVPDGQVNRSLTVLDIGWENYRGENVIALASRCTNLDRLALDERILSPDQQRHLDLLLERKRLCTAAKALGGSPFSVLFRFVEEAHRHEQGLSAIFVILQNDGDDYFCTANNRAID